MHKSILIAGLLLGNAWADTTNKPWGTPSFEGTIDYQFTVEDNDMFTRPWTASAPLTSDQSSRGVTAGLVYEYACHEGNYALPNVLRGARLAEQD